MEDGNMEWTTPKYVEIKMDAEIGSYQEDNEPGREVPLAGGEAMPPEGGGRRRP
jgi:hypothetical protein